MLVKSFVSDLASRAGHTFWQAFCAALGVLWASSGLHVTDLVHVSAWHKLAVAAIAAGSAAALSTVKTLTVAARSTTGEGDVPALEPAVPVAVAAPAGSSAVGAAVPADPAQPAAGVEPGPVAAAPAAPALHTF